MRRGRDGTTLASKNWEQYLAFLARLEGTIEDPNELFLNHFKNILDDHSRTTKTDIHKNAMLDSFFINCNHLALNRSRTELALNLKANKNVIFNLLRITCIGGNALTIHDRNLLFSRFVEILIIEHKTNPELSIDFIANEIIREFGHELDATRISSRVRASIVELVKLANQEIPIIKRKITETNELLEAISTLKNHIDLFNNLLTKTEKSETVKTSFAASSSASSFTLHSSTTLAMPPAKRPNTTETFDPLMALATAALSLDPAPLESESRAAAAASRVSPAGDAHTSAASCAASEALSSESSAFSLSSGPAASGGGRKSSFIFSLLGEDRTSHYSAVLPLPTSPSSFSLGAVRTPLPFSGGPLMPVGRAPVFLSGTALAPFTGAPTTTSTDEVGFKVTRSFLGSQTRGSSLSSSSSWGRF